MKANNWFNDGVWKCNSCEVILFKSYVLGDTEEVQGCPYCCVSGATLIPCDEDGNEQDEE